jgi:hypothetical protein
MNVIVQIPDEMADQLPSGEAISREMLEAYAAEAYRTERLSRRQVGLLLGLDRWKTEEFISQRKANRTFTSDDFSLERSHDIGRR